MKRIIIVVAFLLGIIMTPDKTAYANENIVNSTSIAATSPSSADDARFYAEEWIKGRLKDPKSYKRIEWKAQPSKGNSRMWVVYIKFRAKNSFGGYVIQECVAVVDYGTYGSRYVDVDGIIQ